MEMKMFGVENLADYDDIELRIPFRRRVFPSYLDGEPITAKELVLLGVEGKRRIPDWLLRLANDRVGWDNYPWGEKSAIGLKNDPRQTEAQSDWWISSRAYFDGGIGQAERVPRHLNRQNMYEFPSEFYREFEIQKRDLKNKKKKIEEIKRKEADQRETYEKVHKFMEDMNVEQGGPSSFQTHPNSSSFFNIGKSEQRPSFYKRSPYMEQPATTVLPKQRGNKNKNNVKKANLSPLNLGSAFDDENEGGDDVIFLGGRFTGNYLVYENVDPEKGYSVPVTFWQQLVPHLCRPDIDLSTPMGWFSAKDMNEWMELLIRLRSSNDPWTVAYTNTISVHLENQHFLIETDQHTIGTLDGSTRPYPA
ncbi:hypothetical protein Tco_1257153 [Tanacetum coccineum]